MKYKTLNILFPENLTCNFCDAELPPKATEPICTSCQKEVNRIEGHICSQCGHPIELKYEQHGDYHFKCKACQESFFYFNCHRAYALYESGLKKGIMGLKYKKQSYQARYFAKCLAEVILQNKEDLNFDVIVPVPIHFTRQWQRGYNQSEIIAHFICQQFKDKKLVNALIRRKITKKLKKLNKEARKSTLENAIIMNNAYLDEIKGKRVLIIDDIYTTGSTLNACARVLYENGCENIKCLTVAMGQ